MFKFKKTTLTIVPLVFFIMFPIYAYHGSRLHSGGFAEIEAFNAKINDTFVNEFPYAIALPSFDFPPFNLDVLIEELRRVNNSLQINDDVDRNTLQFFYTPADHNWGGRIAFGYDFRSCNRCQNYGLSLEYTHFNQTSSAATPHFVTPDGLPDLVLVDGFVFRELRYSDADTHLNTKYDTFDLLGHTNKILSDCTHLKIFAGVRYLRFHENIHNHYFFSGEVGGPNPGTSFNEDINHQAKFNGVGPHIGANIFYSICSGFGLKLQGSADLLYGVTESTFRQIIRVHESDGRDSIFDRDNDQHHNSHFVPGLAAKAAFAYYAYFTNCSMLIIEGGYRGDKYFELANHGTYTGTLANVLSAIQDSTYHDIEFDGPYISLSYHL